MTFPNSATQSFRQTKIYFRCLFTLCILSTLGACGGGGRSSSTPAASIPQVVTPPTVVLLAGSFYGEGSINGQGINAGLSLPSALVTDSGGNIFVADLGNAVIRKITPAGVTTDFAGKSGSVGTDNGIGEAARFDSPAGIAIDKDDNLYVSDTGNFLIRKITPSRVVSTLAGKASGGGYDDVWSGNASFYSPDALAVDSRGNVFVSGSGGIRKITPQGLVTTIKNASISFSGSKGIAVDKNDNIFVAYTGDSTIWKISPAGDFTPHTGVSGWKSSTDGVLAQAKFDTPSALHIDGNGNLLVIDEVNNTVRKITPNGIVSTLAGTAKSSPGIADGIGGAAQFDTPRGITSDKAGNVYVSDYGSNTIRKITPDGMVKTWIGRAAIKGKIDGIGAAAQFAAPAGLVTDKAGNFYVADRENNTIRKITPTGTVSTIAGSAGTSGNGGGMGAQASFSRPLAIAIDTGGNLFVVDARNYLIRKITPEGLVSTFAGGSHVEGADGYGSSASFGYPYDIIIDSNNNLFVADVGYNTIRKITPAGLVSTIAGKASWDGGSADGTGSAAQFKYPESVCVDSAGNVYVADAGNHTIRKISPAGLVTTIAGKVGVSGSTDGQGTEASFSYPMNIRVDTLGNLFVADFLNSTIRKITPSGTVTTIAGIAGIANLSPDPTSKTLAFPRSLAFDSKGKLFATMNHGVFQINF